MVSISRIVEKIISEKPFLQEALAKGIINYAGLAENIIPDVEKEFGREVKVSAVMMSLRRLSENLEKATFSNIKFGENNTLTARDGLAEVTLEKNNETEEKIKNLFDSINYQKKDFITITQGIYESTLIMDKKYLKSFVKDIDKKDIINKIENLGAVTLTIPIDFIDTPGFFYLVTKNLTWENINIEEIVSTSRELTCIVKEKDLMKAFNSLKKLVEERK